MCIVVCLSVRFLVGHFPRAFVYYHLKNTLLLAILHTGRTLNFTLPLLDSDRHFVNGLLVCIDPTNALLHESGPF
jgi:hypothetical protein